MKLSTTLQKKSPGRESKKVVVAKVPGSNKHLKNVIVKGIRQSIPANIKPMLCTLVKEPIFNDNLLYEVKWDGYRIIGYKNKKNIRLDSRSGLDYSAKYPPVLTALKKLRSDVVLDGEVVVFGSDGKPDFNALQNYNGSNDPIAYCVFDILWIDGYNIMSLPLTDRKKILEDLLKGNDVLKYSESFEDGEGLFRQMQEIEMEGIVAKQKDSPYVPNERGNRWLKMPTMKRQEFVIGGWAESDRGRSFRSLLFGAYNSEGKFEWIGRSGGGYKEKEMPGILQKLKALEIKKSPFINEVLDTKGATLHFVKPQLVANFSFATWTNTGRIRKPATFLGFRSDKKAKDVVREIAQESRSIGTQINVASTKPLKKEFPKKAALNESTGFNPEPWPVPIDKDSAETITIDNCDIVIDKIDREVWPGITKYELIDYYRSVAPYILPFLKNRPQSLHIKPQGAFGQRYFRKDMDGHQPSCGDIFSVKRKHPSEGKRNVIDFLVCNNLATLLWMVNIGCIDINPWTATANSPHEPDYIVIDLDPPKPPEYKELHFQHAIKTAIAAKKYFDKNGLQVFPKTSGKTGIHLLIPCQGIDTTKCRLVASKICNAIHEMVPDITTTNLSKEHGESKIYIDPNQNDYQDTIAAHYSARPHHIPTVSTPLEWSEVNLKLDNKAFTIHTIRQRIRKKGNVHKDLFSKKIKTANTKILLSLLDMGHV